MSRSTPRLAAAGVVVLLLGVVRGIESNLPVVLETFELGRGFTLYPALEVLTLGTFLLVGTLLGYVWGREADVRSAYVSFVVVLTVALTVGYFVGFAFVGVVSVLGPGSLFGFSFVSGVLWDLSFLLTSLHLPLVALAGAAVGDYHATSDDEYRESTGDTSPS